MQPAGNTLDQLKAIKTGINGGLSINPVIMESPVISGLIAASKIDLSKELPPPEVCFSIVDGYKEVILFTLGNFSAIIGKAKSKKTFFIVMLVAAGLRRLGLYKISSALPEGKKGVIVFDTEQGRYKVQQTGKRICELAELDNPDNLLIYSLRSFVPAQRVEIIRAVIYDKREWVGYVVIDGIRDLVVDINSPEEAVNITTELMKWTEELNIHITTVLHQNKGDTNARGHLGTEVINKAETVLSISKSTDDPNVSICEPEFVREMEFTPFSFAIGESGLPYLTDMPEKNIDQAAARTITPFTILPDRHHSHLKAVFAGGKLLKYKSLVQALKLSLQEAHGQIGDNKTKDFIAYYSQQGWVRKSGEDRSPNAVYSYTGLTQ